MSLMSSRKRGRKALSEILPCVEYLVNNVPGFEMWMVDRPYNTLDVNQKRYLINFRKELNADHRIKLNSCRTQLADKRVKSKSSSAASAPAPAPLKKLTPLNSLQLEIDLARERVKKLTAELKKRPNDEFLRHVLAITTKNLEKAEEKMVGLLYLE